LIHQFTTASLLYLVLATRWTLALSAIAFAGGAVGGLVLALLRVSASVPARLAAGAVIQLVQGTPLLLLLFLAYFGVSLLGLQLDAWTSVSLAMTLYASAFLGDIWRGCIEAVPHGQWEAARSLALPPLACLRLVILPQALRIAIPPTVGFLVQVIKGTALAAIVGFTELTRAAQILNNMTFRPFMIYCIIAVIYFVLCWPLSYASRKLEVRIAAPYRAAAAQRT
jgi:polar amino acid transport system permease protein